MGSWYAFDRMKLLLLLHLALLSHPLQAQSPPCQEICQMTQKYCRVCFSRCDNRPDKRYTFLSCAQLYKDSSFTNNQTLPANTRSFGYEECGSKCCDSSLAIFEESSLSSCSSGLNFLQIIIIIVCVIFSLLVAACCIVSGNEKLRQKLLNCIKSGDRRIGQAEDKHPEQILGQNNSINHLNSDISFTLISGRDSTCAICLQGQSRGWTPCGHPYHLQCLQHWLLRKQECPLCKSKQAEVIYLFCQNCLSQPKAARIKSLTMIELRQLEQYRCNQCSKN